MIEPVGYCCSLGLSLFPPCCSAFRRSSHTSVCCSCPVWKEAGLVFWLQNTSLSDFVTCQSLGQSHGQRRDMNDISRSLVIWSIPGPEVEGIFKSHRKFKLKTTSVSNLVDIWSIWSPEWISIVDMSIKRVNALEPNASPGQSPDVNSECREYQARLLPSRRLHPDTAALELASWFSCV